jgi:hypothetical protein
VGKRKPQRRVRYRESFAMNLVNEPVSTQPIGRVEDKSQLRRIRVLKRVIEHQDIGAAQD